jgi:hypothetical protein
MQPAGRPRRQVHAAVGMKRSTAIVLREAAHDVRPHRIVAGPDPDADRGFEARRSGAEFARQALERRTQDVGGKAAPAGVHDRDHAGCRERDRQAVRGAHGQRHSWFAGDQDIALADRVRTGGQRFGGRVDERDASVALTRVEHRDSAAEPAGDRPPGNIGQRSVGQAERRGRRVREQRQRAAERNRDDAVALSECRHRAMLHSAAGSALGTSGATGEPSARRGVARSGAHLAGSPA